MSEWVNVSECLYSHSIIKPIIIKVISASAIRRIKVHLVKHVLMVVKFSYTGIIRPPLSIPLGPSPSLSIPLHPLPLQFDVTLPLIGQATYDGLMTVAIADLPIGFLFVLAISSLGVYGVALAGWSSQSETLSSQ